MASLTNVQIMNMIGVVHAANRNAIIANLLSGGLNGLKQMTDEDVRDICASYAKRTDNPFPIILTPVQKQRIKSLVLWVKDQGRIGRALAFPASTTQAQFRTVLAEALERERRRKNQKKGESRILTSHSTRS